MANSSEQMRRLLAKYEGRVAAAGPHPSKHKKWTEKHLKRID